jgi:hypothetical protein
VRGKRVATAFAQFGNGWPPPDSTAGIRVQHSASLGGVTGPAAWRDDAATAMVGSSTAPISSRTQRSWISSMNASSRLTNVLQE